MDLSVLIQSAGTMAFPCLFCIYVFKVMTDYMKEKDTKHHDEISKLSEVIQQNTETIVVLKTYIESINNKEV